MMSEITSVNGFSIMSKILEIGDATDIVSKNNIEIKTYGVLTPALETSNGDTGHLTEIPEK